MSEGNNDFPFELEELFEREEDEELLSELEKKQKEDEEPLSKLEKLPANLEDIPIFLFLLEKKSREFIFETLPKIQEQNNCGPRKALYILARSMGYKHAFLHDEEAIKQLHSTIEDLELNFPSKSALASYLAIEKGSHFSFRHHDQTGELIIDVPGLTGGLKGARFKNRVKMKMEGGRHAYYFNSNRTKTVSIKSKKVDQFINNKIRGVMKENWDGFDKVTMIYHTPLDGVDHFLQSMLPKTEISCRYGEAILSTSNKEMKEGKFNLKIKGLNTPLVQGQYVSQNNQNVYLVSFCTSCENFMEKITVIHAFVSKIIEENAYLNREMHKLVQVERYSGEKAPPKHIFPFTLCIEPFSFTDYYYSKFNNVNNLFFSFPKEIGKHGAISRRVILVKKDDGQLTSLENLLEHNKKYMHFWSISLLRNCIENTRMISTQRLRQFLGEATNPSIDQLINQLEDVYEQHQKEVEYYAEKQREKQTRMIRHLTYIVSILLAIFALLEGIQTLLLYL